MVQIEDLVSVSMIIPLVSFYYWHVIFTGQCNSSTIQPTMANPWVNRTPLCECLAICLIIDYTHVLWLMRSTPHLRDILTHAVLNFDLNTQWQQHNTLSNTVSIS